MKSIVIIAIPALLALASVMAWTHYSRASGDTLFMYGAGELMQDAKSIAVSDAPSVIVDSDAGNVDLIGDRAGSVRIEAKKYAPTKSQADRLVYTVDRLDNTIHIFYRQPDKRLSNCHIDFTIRAPKDSVLSITTGGGNIEASAFSRGVTGHTGSGNLRVVNIAGPVRLDTGGGNIEGVRLKGAINLATGGGNIDATGGLSGRISLTTGGGNIAARTADGEVKAHTGAGNISVGGRFTGSSELSSGAGDIKAFIPTNSGLIIHAATTMGTIHDDFGWQENQAPLGRMIAVNGQVGNGPGRLNIMTGIGNVSIKKG